MRYFYFLTLFFTPLCMTAQILDVNPVFPQINDDVTISYNAEEGTGALVGVSPVYAHTGLITENSNFPSDWKYVQGNWGTADPNVLMTQSGPNQWTLSYNIREYYGIPANEKALELAFVFRNTDGSLVGRSEQGGDIFYPIYDPEDGLLSIIIQPGTEFLFEELGEKIQFEGAASLPAQLTLKDNDQILVQTTGESLEYEIEIDDNEFHKVEFIAEANGQTIVQSFNYFAKPQPVVEDPPPGLKDGINVMNDSTVILQLVAPGKEFVLVRGSFSDWAFLQEQVAKKGSDGNVHWLEMRGLDPDSTYLLHYVVDGEVAIADPYSEIILTEIDDQWIPEDLLNGLPPFPYDQTFGNITVFRTRKDTFDWQVNNFEKPANTDLVIYELLMRDFLADHNYTSLLDTLDYLSRLGINAIELMPVNEFEGNLSWGYNPSYHMALDKYYGNPEQFKALVDACHERGIAVIVDVVFNHAFSQNPFFQMYFDPNTRKPTPDNPWLNVDPKHDFNVGFDFNHESQFTRNYVKQILEFWLKEYRIDGFRFDLSKGFTQKNTLGDVAAWGQKDDDRIAILKDYADHIWSVDPDAYVTLEHFAENSEEKELAEYGMMLWGNQNHNYSQAAMGYANSNFNGGSYKNKGWSVPHLITYMESHDEERMMYRLLENGNSSGDYDTKDFATALERVELCAAMFFTIPGPKMLWQFGELGYDYSINHCVDGTVNNNCRLDPKPIRWDYQDQLLRKRLFDVFSALIKLKSYEAFESTDFTVDAGNPETKKILINHESFDVAVFGNFGLTSRTYAPGFQYTGKWYEYFSGDSINISSLNQPISFQPGEYRIYTSKRLETPDVVSSIFDLKLPAVTRVEVFPQPNAGNFRITFPEAIYGQYNWMLFDTSGRPCESGTLGFSGDEAVDIALNRNHPTGMYFLQLSNGEEVYGARVMLASQSR